MKTLLISFLAAAALCSLSTVPANADTGIYTRKGRAMDSAVQGKVLSKDVIVAPTPANDSASSPAAGKVIGKDVIVDPATRRAQNSRVKDVHRAMGVYVSSFSAKRESGRIVIPAFLSTAMDQPTNVRYTIARRVGGRWKQLAGGAVTIPAGQPLDVSTAMAPTNDFVELRIDVMAAGANTYSAPEASKTYKLKALKVSFVLAYATNADEWVLAYMRKGEVDTNQLQGAAAKKRAEELAAYGFQGKVSIKTSKGLTSDTEEVKLWVRTPGTLTRTFDTAEEALEYSRTMKSLIHDSVRVWTRVTEE